MAPLPTRLDYLLSRYKTGLASEEERWELTILLEQDWDKIPAGLQVDHIDWQQMLESIKREGKRKTPVRALPLLRSGLFRAAAVILVLAIGTGLYIGINHRLNKSLAVRKMPARPADIPPGINKAILTLSGGRRLILDSTAKDTLLAEGADIIACAKGRLAYSAGNVVTDAGTVYNTLTTPRGGQFQLTLPDGTRVWLNAASSIRYPTVFNGKDRTVSVTGETYFEVAPKAGQPFVVQSGKMAATVLGTSFNINAYADESMIRTSLIEGSLRVGEANNSTLLTPGQQAQMDKSDVIQVAKMSNPASAIAWKNGYFSFEKADIPAVMRQLSRWYNIEVSYEDGKAPADYFWGDLQRNARLSDILAVLEKSGISFAIKGNKLLVLNKHQINARQ
jgi:transmembrane sensor